MRKAWQIGDHIDGRWEIFRMLEGGAGVVYIVYDHAFHEVFAAKTFRDEVFAYSPEIADRFTQEALVWTGMDIHPNVAQARMLEKVGGRPFLFLEYVSGGDLGSWIGTPRLTEDPAQLLRFGSQFCEGMVHALSKGIRAHRDIKPRNCLVTHDCTLKVTDFGLAKLLEIERYALIPTGKQNIQLTKTAVGTCTHMAPEQFKNADIVDSRGDIYSFGVMLYQMVSGDLPFVGESWEDLEHLHNTCAAPRLAKADRRLADLVEACLEKNPRNRPSDFLEVRNRLDIIYKDIAGSPLPSPVQGPALTATQWNNKGSSLDNLGRRAESIASFDAALQIDPFLVSAWFNKGVALFAMGRVDEALICYERALKIEPKSGQAWSNRGVALKSLGRTQDALVCYDRALENNPRNPKAWINKGVAYRGLGKLQDALACYERALQLDPNDPNGWTNKGNVLYALGRSTEAITCYEKALSRNSGLELAWLNKGIALAATGKHEESLTCYGTALEINPQLQQAWFLRGQTLVNVFQKYREAIPFFEEAERLGVHEAKQALALCKKVLGRV